MPKAYSYKRFSSHAQADGDSLRRQTEKAEKYALEHGLELDTSLTYEDKGISAFQGANLKVGKLGEFLQAVYTGRIEPDSFLLVESLDRISRDSIVEAQSAFLSIITAGITIVTLIDGKQYSRDLLNKTPSLIFEAIFTLIRANDESKTKADRVASAWSQKRKNAIQTPITGKIPAWLTLNREANSIDTIPERVAIVQRIFHEHLMEGKGQETIARQLNLGNVPPWGTCKKNRAGERKAPRWNKSYVTKILSNPAVIGQFTPHTVKNKNRTPLEPIPGYYPAVIDDDIFFKVQNLHAGHVLKGKRPTDAVKNIFARLARCPFCGSIMTRINKGGARWQYLVCTKAKAGAGCSYHSLPYDKTEEVFMEWMQGLQIPIDRRRLEKLEAEQAKIKALIERTELELTNITEAIKAGTRRKEDVMDNFMGEPVDWSDYPGEPVRLIDEMHTMEAEIKAKRKALDRLSQEHSQSHPILINQKIQELREAVATAPDDKTLINSKLFGLCEKIVMGYQDEEIRLHYRHTDIVSRIPYTGYKMKNVTYNIENPFTGDVS